LHNLFARFTQKIVRRKQECILYYARVVVSTSLETFGIIDLLLKFLDSDITATEKYAVDT
jgi:hypothetical protein